MSAKFELKTDTLQMMRRKILSLKTYFREDLLRLITEYYGNQVEMF